MASILDGLFPVYAASTYITKPWDLNVDFGQCPHMGEVIDSYNVKFEGKSIDPMVKLKERFLFTRSMRKAIKGETPTTSESFTVNACTYRISSAFDPDAYRFLQDVLYWHAFETHFDKETKYMIVPIPGRNSTSIESFSQGTTTTRLAEALANTLTRHDIENIVQPVLYFNSPQPSQYETGQHNNWIRYQAMEVDNDFVELAQQEKYNIILLDDFVTLGATMCAARKRLDDCELRDVLCLTASRGFNVEYEGNEPFKPGPKMILELTSP